VENLFLLSSLGQSVWFDYIDRRLITTGKLDELIDLGVRGITSNPTIFEKAITGSMDYDEEINKYVANGLGAEEIYEKLVLTDIGLAADKFKDLYLNSGRTDGFVSVEVNPDYAHDLNATIKEAVKLFSLLNRENVMIKVPATQAGIKALPELIALGINVNVTLIFGMENYIDVAKAYILGLQKLKERGGDLSKVASVASFFVSRVDTYIDSRLEEKKNTKLAGKIAIANSKLSYLVYKKIFSGNKWKSLEKRGARKQRLLWASTGTKNPSYSDTMYVDKLIGHNTVNTIPPQTLNAFLAHGKVKSTLQINVNEAKNDLTELEHLGISLTRTTRKLQIDGIKAFADSFHSLINSLSAKIYPIQFYKSITVHPEGFDFEMKKQLKKLNTKEISRRLFDKDYTLWSKQPKEIENRLGWVDSPNVMRNHISEIALFVSEIKSEGFTRVLLLGMGGSSLAPEVLSEIFKSRDGFPYLEILDSTDPEMVRQKINEFPCVKKVNGKLTKTLYVVSTKSGGTVETFSLMKYFYREVLKRQGRNKAGKYFMAITDPGSGLEQIAKQFSFRKIFLNDPDIGGRYSALSMFGLVPAALMGIRISKLISRADLMIQITKDRYRDFDYLKHPIIMGDFLGFLANTGINKLIFTISDTLYPFGHWIEQLVAESSGKIGKGILPVIERKLGDPDKYGPDVAVVSIRMKNENPDAANIRLAYHTGHPVFEIVLNDKYDLGAQFMFWEIVTVMACRKMGVQPFDQPDVESAKISARKELDAYRKTGKVKKIKPVFKATGVKILSDKEGKSKQEIETKFFRGIKSGKNYIAIQAYVNKTPAVEYELAAYKKILEEKYKVPVTIGYGPRFLHSTGQLHKGDRGDGYFVQILNSPKDDLPIPDDMASDKSSVSFGILRNAQAFGDREALLAKKRKVLTYIFDAELDLIQAPVIIV